MNKTNGEIMIIELSKSENSVFGLKIRSAGDVLGDEPSPMMIDNTFLHGRGVNINNLFYRYSRLAELEVAYTMTQMVSLPVTEGRIMYLPYVGTTDCRKFNVVGHDHC